MGYVMVFMCNEYVVYECKGVYYNVFFMYDGKMGVVVNFDIDLWLFMWEWEYGYVVEVFSWGKVLYSL